MTKKPYFIYLNGFSWIIKFIEISISVLYQDIDFSDSGKAADKISKLITHHSASLADPSVVTAKGKNKRNVYVKLILTARLHFSLGRITIILMETVLMKIIV